MFFSGIIFLSSLYLVAGNTPITSCGTGSLPAVFQLGSCSALPCTITRGAPLNLVIQYTYPAAYSTPYISLKLYYNSRTFVYPISLCDYGPCFVQAGQTATYTITGDIPSNAPTGAINIQVSFRGSIATELFCAALSAEVV